MAIDKEQILSLLGTGLSQELVATAVGCTPSYITQLMSDEEFANQVSQKRILALQSHTKRDAKLDDIEDTLIAALEKNLEMIYKPKDILNTLVRVNMMKRRGPAVQESTVVNNTVVNLTMPKKLVQHFTLNSKSEVIEVEGQTMVTMPAGQLLRKLAAEHKGSEEDNTYAKASKFLPAGPSGTHTAVNNKQGNGSSYSFEGSFKEAEAEPDSGNSSGNFQPEVKKVG